MLYGSARVNGSLPSIDLVGMKGTTPVPKGVGGTTAGCAWPPPAPTTPTAGWGTVAAGTGAAPAGGLATVPLRFAGRGVASHWRRDAGSCSSATVSAAGRCAASADVVTLVVAASSPLERLTEKVGRCHSSDRMARTRTETGEVQTGVLETKDDGAATGQRMASATHAALNWSAVTAMTSSGWLTQSRKNRRTHSLPMRLATFSSSLSGSHPSLHVL